MVVSTKTALYGTLTAVVLKSIIGLCCDKTYGTMTNYDDKYDYINEYQNNYDNAASGSGSDGPIFDQITNHWSCRVESVTGRGRAYSCGALYSYPSKYVT